MKRYVHKTLGWVAEEYFKTGKFYISKINDDGTEVDIAHHILPELIGADREEIIENDWIDEFVEDFLHDNNIVALNRGGMMEYVISKEMLKQHIENYAPKQKKFTREEINRYKFSYSIQGPKTAVIEFLKDHGLLSSSDE